MRFRKDKGGDGAGLPGPPDASTRVEEPATQVIAAPPPTASARVEEPTAAKPASESAAPPEPGKIFRDAPPPSAAQRLDAPPPSAGSISAPPPSGQPVSTAPAAAVACPQCGTPAQAGQEMCINCGSRIAREPAEGSSRGWRVPALLAAIGILLVGTAIAFGVLALTNDDDLKKDDVADLSDDPPPATPPPATPPPATPPPTQPTIPPATRETQPDPATPVPDDTPQTTPEPDPSAGTSGPAEWPEGETAYTVVLVSATSRNAADAKAEQAIKRGIQAGVLRSDDFSTLRPGFWVVFAGQYDSSEEATRAADRYAEQGFGGGYPRQVKPK